MRIRILAIGVALAGILPVSAGSAAAQEVDWERGTTLSVFGGAGVTGSHAGGAAGFALGWELWPFLTVEGAGTWVDERGHGDGFAGLLGARVPVVRRGTIVPFGALGLGVYRASIDPAHRDLPAFYGRRLGVGAPPRGERVFDDFMVAVGGGADVYVTQHLSLRPDVRVLMARADGRTRPVTIVGLHLAYHFEDHFITP
jgi:hypothetical protein